MNGASRYLPGPYLGRLGHIDATDPMEEDVEVDDSDEVEGRTLRVVDWSGLARAGVRLCG